MNFFFLRKNRGYACERGRIRRFQAEGTVGGNFIIGAESVQDCTKASVAKSIAGKEGAGA